MHGARRLSVTDSYMACSGFRYITYEWFCISAESWFGKLR